LEQPASVRLAQALRYRGWPISFNAVDMSSVAEEIRRTVKGKAMSEFEFLPSATIGQYIPTGSILHRMEPRAKLIGFGVLILAITFSLSSAGIAIGLAAALLGLLVARIPIRFALKGLTPPLPFLVFIAVLQIFLYPSGGQNLLFTLGPLQVSLAGIWSGVLLILRFSALILVLMPDCLLCSPHPK